MILTCLTEKKDTDKVAAEKNLSKDRAMVRENASIKTLTWSIFLVLYLEGNFQGSAFIL